jgi:hypothetical protein
MDEGLGVAAGAVFRSILKGSLLSRGKSACPISAA